MNAQTHSWRPPVHYCPITTLGIILSPSLYPFSRTSTIFPFILGDGAEFELLLQQNLHQMHHQP
jgi:hypothetical protein